MHLFKYLFLYPLGFFFTKDSTLLELQNQSEVIRKHEYELEDRYAVDNYSILQLNIKPKRDGFTVRELCESRRLRDT